jgi:aryl-alcohol dehydrogenase-like predicted oxidoreductase
METSKMPLTPLGQTGLSISRVGFGAWAIGGGGYQFGWGDQSDTDSIAAIHEAVARGVNWIDTAAVYGLGRSEQVVGRAIAELPDRPYVFTKAGRLDDGSGRIIGNLKRDSIRRELNESLARLGVDAVDLYQIHWPDPEQQIEEGWAALVELKEEGLVRHIGVSNFDVRQMARLEAIAPVETLQPPYSLLARGIEPEILPFAEQHGIGVIVYSPMASGLLTGAMTRERIAALPESDWRSRHPRFTEPELTRNLDVVTRLEGVAARHGTTPGSIAVAWAIRNPAVTAAIVGFRNPDQVTKIIDAASITLSSNDLDTLENGPS